MFPWILFWSPQLYFPWSGNVTQAIDPDTEWVLGAVTPRAGNGRVEKRTLTEVASYGRQLGWITEVLMDIANEQAALSPQAAQSLAKLKAIRDRIEAIKREEEPVLVIEPARRVRRSAG